MTLNFQMRREDILAFSREYHAASPTLRRTRNRARFMFPAILLVFWISSLSRYGFHWSQILIYLGGGLLWFILYPARFNRRIEKYAEKTFDEGAHGKSLGPYELTFSETGLHSKCNMGESNYYWSAIDRIQLTDSYLFIFLNGPIGYPIPIVDIGREAAVAACEYANTLKETYSGNDSSRK